MSDDLPVFLRVAGKLVPKPGGKRDLNRRYSSVFGPEGNYLLEFTEEEERQRDEDEARDEAERPQREAARQRSEEDAARFRESLKYENRVVAFLDILGWKEGISRSQLDPELTRELGLAANFLKWNVDANKHAKTFWIEHGLDDPSGDLQVTHFSDSIVISMTDAPSAKAHMEIVSKLRSVIQMLMHIGRGYFVRGGVTFGSLIHRDSLMYGPAFNRALEIEQTADVPRIVLAPELAHWAPGARTDDLNGDTGHSKDWRLDSDGKYFLDFLQPFGANTLPVLASLDDFRPEPARTLITKNLAEHRNNPRIYKKYVWLAEYFNSVADEYPKSESEKIIIPE